MFFSIAKDELCDAPDGMDSSSLLLRLLRLLCKIACIVRFQNWRIPHGVGVILISLIQGYKFDMIEGKQKSNSNPRFGPLERRDSRFGDMVL